MERVTAAQCARLILSQPKTPTIETSAWKTMLYHATPEERQEIAHEAWISLAAYSYTAQGERIA